MKLTLSVAAIWCFLYLLARALIARLGQPQQAYWGVSLLFLVAFLFAIAEIAWSKRALGSLEDMIAELVVSRKKGSVRRWYRQVIRKMYDPLRSAITAIAFLPLVLAVVRILNWNRWIPSSALRSFDTACQIAMALVMASSQWPFASISLFVSKLPEKKLSINFYAHRKDSVMSLGSLLLQIDLGGVTLTSLVALTLYVAPANVPIVVSTILIGTFLWAVIWFFLTQLSLHRSMMDEKRARIKPVSERLMASLDLAIAGRSPQAQDSFENLKKLHDELTSLPEWPFRTDTVLKLASGVLLPIILSLLNLAMRR